MNQYQTFQLILPNYFHFLMDFVNSAIFCENCSHFILKWFQPNSFGEMCFLEGRYEKMQKIQILKILRLPFIQNWGVSKLTWKLQTSSSRHLLYSAGVKFTLMYVFLISTGSKFTMTNVMCGPAIKMIIIKSEIINLD